MIRRHVKYSIHVAACALFAVAGCKRHHPTGPSAPVREDDRTEAVRYLTNIATANAGIDERRQRALDNLTNDTIDSEPVLIFAKAGRASGYSDVRVNLLCVDEDRDLLGVGFRNVIQADGGQSVVVLDEEYPAFAHVDWSTGPELVPIIVPVQLRDSEQRRDPRAWADYLSSNTSKILLRDLLKQGDVMPAVWVSLPEPNGLDVEVYVYDRAGHESEPVSLNSPLELSEEQP